MALEAIQRWARIYHVERLLADMTPADRLAGRQQLSQQDVARLARESGLVSARPEYTESIWHVPN